MVDEYDGRLGRTRRRTVHVTCQCGRVCAAEIYEVINVRTDADLGDRLVSGTLNHFRCPSCEELTPVALPVVYHNPGLRIFCVVLPSSMRHAEIETRIDLLRTLTEDPVDLPSYVRQAEVVFGGARLQERLAAVTSTRLSEAAESAQAEKLAEREAVLEQRRGELEQLEEELQAREEDLATKQEDLVARQAALDGQREELDQARAELKKEREALRGLSIDLAGRAQRRQPPPVPEDAEVPVASTAEPLVLENRPQQAVDTWRTSDRATGSFLHQGEVYLAARPGADLTHYREQRPRILFQMRMIEGVPLAALGILPAVEVHAPEARNLWWLLDPCAEADRLLLEALGERCAAHLDLYDEESRPVGSWAVEAPLEDNIRLALGRSERMESTPETFARATEAFFGLDPVDQLGRKQHNFADESFVDLPSPAAVRLALGIVGYWSEPENEDYLLLVKAFPLPHWRALQQRVVQGAAEFGLRLSDSLASFAVECGVADSRAELLRLALANAAEVSLRLKPSDLEPLEEWENWRLLLDDCVRHRVEVEPQIEELAAAAARRGQSRAGPMVDETEPGGDLSTLSDDELLPLLSDRALRRDAALEICERGQTSHAAAVFSAVRNMTRSEVARVIPAVVNLGPEIVTHLVQGLAHRKSFIRQGCALALGALRVEAGVDPLVDMLLNEPTRIWMEAARALGDVGHRRALKRICAASVRVDGDGRERLAWALAYLGLEAEGRAELTALSAGADPLLAKLAWRGLELVPQVTGMDREVRGGPPPREQTIVRSFTRRFYECLGGEFNELDEEDIVDQEEVLGDSDILEESEVPSSGEVEVNNGDIVENDSPTPHGLS